ncbi:SpoIIE family protein phosphatase [Anaerolineales bacterium HSG24]|nr:SpoIIE family protein phosphatase [Anaerolineales bacterium HSG24]
MPKGSIVCVDDERSVLISLRDQLASYLGDDYEIELAESGEEALEIFEELVEDEIPIPVIICDQIMPEMSGDQLLIKLHANYPQTLKIMLTGQADAQAIGNVVNKANLYRYLTKPWDKTDLRMTVHEAIRRYFQELQLTTQAEALHQSESRLRAIFDTVMEGIVTTDPQGIIESFNPAASHIFGYDVAEMIGKNIGMLLPFDYPNQLSDHTGQKKVASIKKELLGRHQDGHSIPLEISLSEIKAENLWLYTGIISDITERKQAQLEQVKLAAIELELATAKQIQQTLLPPANPNWANLDVICCNLPAHAVGGDFYAYHQFELPIGLLNQQSYGSYALAIGDVSGKGTPAALLMAVSLAWFQATMRQELSPSELLEYLDQALIPYSRRNRQNCALVYVEINQVTTAKTVQTKVRFANAGCIPPYIKRKNGVVEQSELGGFALGQGLGMEIGYQEESLALSPGDTLILVSDGVVEANNHAREMLGFDSFRKIIERCPIANAQTVLECLKQELFAFSGDAEQHDDMTIVVVRI